MKQRIKRRALWLGATALLAVAALSLWQSMAGLTVTEYAVLSPKVTTEIRLVQLSDLHDNALLINDGRLAAQVRALSPDVILLTGDLINYNSETDAQALALLGELKAIAPLYLSVGNHEVNYIRRTSDDGLINRFQEAGAVALNGRYADITVKGQQLRVGGLYGDAYNKRGLEDEIFRGTDTYRFLTAFEDTEALKVLLCHKPEHLMGGDDGLRWDVDLALCGHEHGGQVRLPIVGGFYSPHLGLFSPYLDGVHLMNGIPAVISRGLGTYTRSSRGFPVPPRFWNTPEIVLLTVNATEPPSESQ